MQQLPLRLFKFNFWISYLFRPTSLSYYSSKLSNIWEKSTFQIRQKLFGSGGIVAGAGFLPDLVKVPYFLTSLQLRPVTHLPLLDCRLPDASCNETVRLHCSTITATGRTSLMMLLGTWLSVRSRVYMSTTGA